MTNAARVLDALGDPTRRRIFEVVARAPASVTDIAKQVPVSRPAVSQHLRVLKEAGLVKDDPDGTRRVYRIEHAGLFALRRYLDPFWDSTLERFKAAAEREAEREEKDRKGTHK